MWHYIGYWKGETGKEEVDKQVLKTVLDHTLRDGEMEFGAFLWMEEEVCDYHHVTKFLERKF